MAWKTVANYSSGFSLAKKQFSFYYTLAGQQTTNQIFVTPQQLLALNDMFRNAAPIQFNTTGKYFASTAR